MLSLQVLSTSYEINTKHIVLKYGLDKWSQLQFLFFFSGELRNLIKEEKRHTTSISIMSGEYLEGEMESSLL